MLKIKTLEQRERELPNLNQARHLQASLIFNNQLFEMGGKKIAKDFESSIECLGIFEKSVWLIIEVKHLWSEP